MRRRMGALGTGMAFGAYPYTTDERVGCNVSQTQEPRQRVQNVTTASVAVTKSIVDVQKLDKGWILC